jgi:anti-sigma factor RsiW
VNANSTHLGLEDLIAEVNGQAIGDRAREHLAGCEQCQLEANRWNLVADGIRDLAAEAAEVPEPVRPRRTWRRVPAGPWRRAMMVVGSAAAAIVLLLALGTAAGLVHVYVHLSGPGSEATLTSVGGCARLVQANGTLERVNGAGMVIKTVLVSPAVDATQA